MINAYTENSEKLMIDAGIYGESEQKLSKSKKVYHNINIISQIRILTLLLKSRFLALFV